MVNGLVFATQLLKDIAFHIPTCRRRRHEAGGV